MYKIEIDWGFKSPHLQVVTGTVRIDEIQFGVIDPVAIEGIKVKKEATSTEYTNCSAIFSRCKPLVDIMVQSYFDGMRLRNHSVEWFKNSHRLNNEVFFTLHD